jgi:hypothetical protein
MRVGFSRLLDRRLIQPSDPRDLNARDTPPDFLPSDRSVSNARHHPPPQAIEINDKQRVGGRVHAVVRRMRSLNSLLKANCVYELACFVKKIIYMISSNQLTDMNRHKPCRHQIGSPLLFGA